MNITETRVKLVNDSTDRLKAYCSITIDGCFVIRDLKVIAGASGLFVAMPSRKLSARCPGCGTKNHLRSRFCSDCGKEIGDLRVFKAASRNKLHADVAHPINAECRKFIQTRVIEEYEVEVECSRQPGYKGSSYDEGYEEGGSPYEELVGELKADQTRDTAAQGAASEGTPSTRREGEPPAEPAPTEEPPTDRDVQAAPDDPFGAGLV
jgi:stage V sporulation protein G